MTGTPNRDKQGRFASPLYREFRLFTNGELPCLDRLAIISQCFDEMDDENERRATLNWIVSKYGEPKRKTA